MFIPTLKTSRKRLRTPLLLILLTIAIGVVGFMSIEGYSFLDALYMTVITVATVGFSEVRPLSENGQIFTIFLIIGSIGLMSYSVSMLAAGFIEGELRTIFKDYRKKKGLRKMQNHIIICGYGRNGRQAAMELKAYKRSFVIIDNNPAVHQSVTDNQAYFIDGDATEDDVLIQAGVKTATALITTLPNDADNLFVVLSARSLNSTLNIISRASNESAETKLRKAGVTNTVMPERVGGSHMATMVVLPDVVEFLDHISITGKDATNLVEITCRQINESFQNQSIREMQIRIKTGANIIGYKTPDGEFIVNPHPDTMMILGSKLFVLGTPDQIDKMREMLKP